MLDCLFGWVDVHEPWVAEGLNEERVRQISVDPFSEDDESRFEERIHVCTILVDHDVHGLFIEARALSLIGRLLCLQA